MRASIPQVLLPERSDEARTHLEVYFQNYRGKQKGYSGRVFDTLDHGASPADSITAADLLAVSMLSVRISGTAAQQFLEDTDGIRTNVEALLGQIDAKLSITSAEGRDLLRRDHSVLSEVWDEMRRAQGFGPVVTSKLLARKRPRLVPVFDNKVASALGLSGSKDHWTRMADFFEPELSADVYDERGLAGHLKDLWSSSIVPEGCAEKVSLLRVFDVIVWRETKFPSLKPREEGSNPSRLRAAPRSQR